MSIYDNPRPVEELESKEPYKKPFNRTASMSIPLDNEPWGTHLQGPVYEIDGKEYMVSERVSMYDPKEGEEEKVFEKYKGKIYDRENNTFLNNETAQPVMAEVNKQVEEDKTVEQAREEKAMALANGDETLEQILLANINYDDGKTVDKPVQSQGINFYQVGRNSTQDFFLGVKDGQRYERTVYDGEEAIASVDSFEGGYYGHR
jgi:hypothetical protein